MNQENMGYQDRMSMSNQTSILPTQKCPGYDYSTGFTDLGFAHSRTPEVDIFIQPYYSFWDSAIKSLKKLLSL